MPPPSSDPSSSSGLPFATVLAVLALAAAAAGWHLPWAQGQEQLKSPLNLSAHELDELAAELARPGDHDKAREAVRRLRENDGVRGTDLLALLDHAATTGRIAQADQTERRAWTAALQAGHVLVWAPLGLLLLVVLGGRSPLGRLVRGVLIAHGAIVLAGAGLLVLGASQHARDAFAADATIVGWGLYALVGGSLLGVLVGLFGGKRGGILGALGVMLLLLAGVGGAVVAYLRA